MTTGASNNFQKQRNGGSDVQEFRDKFLNDIKKLSLRDAIVLILREKKVTDMPTVAAILDSFFNHQQIRSELILMDVMGLIWFNPETGVIQALSIIH